MKETKFKVAITILASALIIGYTALQLIDLANIHKTNQRLIEECFQSWTKNNTLTITKTATNQMISCEKQ
ncbi:hypothetical protein [Metasolibacillus sp.]|uniref:hypothetical protein n=1 Tax=Metasolibacillus sp. TaxID=2703680 RepID=UPI0025E68E7D|nr:hypothetical protein [Metasolibacillus sp.]MCT6925379.1 hypothetical protein [Metasolibacillus sp.]MCT6941593.1 hypothetical protein [Metasolibacillus sp.]